MKPIEILKQYNERLSKMAGAFVSGASARWKPLSVVAGILLSLSVGFLVYALYRAPAQATPPAVDLAAGYSTSTIPLGQRALDGVIVDASSTQLLPLGVMVENSADAWPLQGPAKANLVFEAPVEGGITRFLLVFDASSTVEEIGSVRSARSYFVDFADGLNAYYAHVGGSPAALGLINRLPDFSDLNEFYNGWAFWRSSRRAAPHNVYTRTELLLQAADKAGVVPGSFEPWTYGEAPTSTPATADVPIVRVPYDGWYAAEWQYESPTDTYVRYRAGAPIRDADGTIVRAKNVVVLLTDGRVLDDIGRLDIRTTGKGSAWVFTGGGKREATWSRSSGSHLRFEGVDGSEIVFHRGTTWISIVTGAASFASVLPATP